MKKVKCVNCGADKQVSNKAYDARVAKFGSEESMKKDYKCRDCRKIKPAADAS